MVQQGILVRVFYGSHLALGNNKIMKTEKIDFWWKDGFFDYPIEGGVGITSEYWQALLDGQSSGKKIEGNEEGVPILVEPGPRTLEEHRSYLLDQIRAYDISPAVNSFTIGDAELWFDKATRSSLAVTLDAEAAAGKTTTTLWYGTEPPVAIEISIDEVRDILSELEVYAKEVYNATQRHRAAVYGLNTIEEMKAYDHAAGYPERLRFTARE